MVAIIFAPQAPAQNWSIAEDPPGSSLGSLGGDDDEDDDNVLTVLLVPDNSSFDLRANDFGQGPFYIGGTLFDVDTGAELGAFQCWGWFFTDSRRMVTQEYNLGDRGTIIVAGEEIVNTLALVGGTGDFGNAGGQAEFEFVAEGVLVHFSLIGADADS